MATQTSSSTCTNLVDPEEAKAFITSCIEKCGSLPEHASCLADVLIAADLRGHYSHGLNRLEMYANELLKGQCDGKMTPVVVKETPATAYVDARNGIGTVRALDPCAKAQSSNFPPMMLYRWPESSAWN